MSDTSFQKPNMKEGTTMAENTTTLYLIRENDLSGGTADERTYFAIPRVPGSMTGGGELTLLLPETDPRSARNRGHIFDSAGQFRSLGLDPGVHRFRAVYYSGVTILQQWENWRADRRELDGEMIDETRPATPEAASRLRLVVLHEDGPYALSERSLLRERLAGLGLDWSDADTRTFYAASRSDGGMQLLLTTREDDPRHLALFPLVPNEDHWLGVDASTHRAYEVPASVAEDWTAPAEAEQAEPEFKVGDRVRIVEASHVNADRCVGSVGILTNTDATGVYGNVLHPYWVDVTEGQYPREYGASKVEHARTEDEPEFRVGDFVRIAAAHGLGDQVLEGAILSIDPQRTFRGVPHPYRVHVGVGSWLAQRVELLKPRTPTRSQGPRTPLEEAEARLAALKEDTAILAEALKQEAIDRGWCGEYEEFINKVNPTLSEPLLTPRTNEYKVVVTVEMTVDATDFDTARARANESVRRQVHKENTPGLTINAIQTRRL